MRDSTGVLTVDVTRKALEENRDVWWRGYCGKLVAIEERAQRDGSWKIVKLEGVFRSPVTGGAVTVPVPPDEVRLAP